MEPLAILVTAALAAPARLCADDLRQGTELAPWSNEQKRTVSELLKLPPADDAEAQKLLAARPRHLSPFVNWAEGVPPGARWIRAKAGAARIEAAGYQVCIRDANGRFWYFRNVPGDLW